MRFLTEGEIWTQKSFVLYNWNLEINMPYIFSLLIFGLQNVYYSSIITHEHLPSARDCVNCWAVAAVKSDVGLKEGVLYNVTFKLSCEKGARLCQIKLRMHENILGKGKRISKGWELSKIMEYFRSWKKSVWFSTHNKRKKIKLGR